MNVRQVVPRGAIPSVDDPTFVDEYFGDPDDDVVVVSLGEEVRAYPLRILHYHEIVNDVVDRRPVAVTWCPLCGSAVAYDRTVDEGERPSDIHVSDASAGPDGRLALSFGVSGKLADDDLVMYDRETDSEWKQSLGEAIAGPLEGTELETLPAAVVPYRRYREEYTGPVLARPGGESEAAGPGDDTEPIDYDAGPYDDYFESEGFGLDAHRGGDGRTWDRDDLDPKTVVLGVEADGDALGFPLPRAADEGGVVQATVGDRDLVAFVADGIHAFEDPGYAYDPADAEGRFRADGTTWDGATGESEDGRTLDRVPARRLFAFAWQDDHGPDAFYG
jgi:hypothetical protein